MNGHHLILGELEDLITGETIKDTLDERYRQKIAQLLINKKGYLKTDIRPRQKLMVSAGDCKGMLKLDFVINVAGRTGMIIKFGPGSIVTRRRPALAASRFPGSNSAASTASHKAPSLGFERRSACQPSRPNSAPENTFNN